MAKVSKESVDYRDGSQKRRCGICIMFRSPHGCTAVAGEVSASMLCDLFKRKKSAIHDHPRS